MSGEHEHTINYWVENWLSRLHFYYSECAKKHKNSKKIAFFKKNPKEIIFNKIVDVIKNTYLAETWKKPKDSDKLSDAIAIDAKNFTSVIKHEMWGLLHGDDDVVKKLELTGVDRNEIIQCTKKRILQTLKSDTKFADFSEDKEKTYLFPNAAKDSKLIPACSTL